MATIEIKYVDKLAQGHEHITHLGSGAERFTRGAVIRRLELPLHLRDTFYVLGARGAVAYLQVINDRVHGKYVRTVADGTPTDNLLHLPPCPIWLPLVA